MKALARALSNLFNDESFDQDRAAEAIRWAVLVAGIADGCEHCMAGDGEWMVWPEYRWPLRHDRGFIYRCDRCGHCWPCWWSEDNLNTGLAYALGLGKSRERTSIQAVVKATRRGKSLPSPSGGRIVAHSWGRHFVYIEIDRFRTADWPPEAAEVLSKLGSHLAWLALYQRGVSVSVSSFGSFGHLYAPAECAQRILDVLIDADAGDLTLARRAEAIAAKAFAELDGHPSKTAKRQAAPALVAQLVAEVNR